MEASEAGAQGIEIEGGRMISQKLAVRYLADETSDCPIPMAPERFTRKRFVDHDFVHFGHVGVRAYKHANRWQFHEPDVRNAGRAIAELPWDPEDLIEPWPSGQPDTVPEERGWRGQISRVIQRAVVAAHTMDSPSCELVCPHEISAWSPPSGVTPADLLQRWDRYAIACTLPIPALVWTNETWLLPRTLSVILDRWEESERALSTTREPCSGCGIHGEDSSWRTPTVSGWKVLCPACAAASLRSYRQELAGVTYARVRERGPQAEDYLCAVCEQPRPAAAWDHCHEHGLIRGPLCGSCNTMEGQGKEFLVRKGSVQHLLRCDSCRRSRSMPAHHRLAALRRHLHRKHGIQGCASPMHFCVSITETDSGFQCRVCCFGQRSFPSDIHLTASEAERILARVMDEEADK
jgi:hypothetical protein